MAQFSSQPPGRRKVARRTFEFLKRHRFDPEFQGSERRFTQVAFRHEGDRFVVQLDEDDEDFLQVNLALSIPTPPPELSALRRAHEVQGRMKVVKIWLGPGQRYVEFQAPLLLGGHPLRIEPLRTCMSILRRAAWEFHDSNVPYDMPVAVA
jgi:hypothetical protein